MKTVALCCAAMLLMPVRANLLVNGDFEQDLSVGWVQTKEGVGTQTISRATNYDPDPDYEARTYQYSGEGLTRLSQLVAVPGANVELRFNAKFQIGNGSLTCWPVASVCVEYLNAANNVLGMTFFYYHDQYCTWTNTPTQHLIEVTEPAWQNYRLDVQAELTVNLPGVNPADVSKVRVALHCYTSSG
ncbi:MAG: hypothetical protein ABIL25_04545 [candidate division WOR-3 bacterium]